MKNISYITNNIFLKIIILLITLLLVTSCSNPDLDGVKKEIKDTIPPILLMGDKLTLPSDIDGKPLEFKVNKPGYIDSLGNVIKVELVDIDLDVFVKLKVVQNSTLIG